MNKTNRILLGVVLVLVVVLIVLVAWQFFFSSSPFYAVYMKTGDVYFGKLQRFPSFGLTDVYTLAVNQQNAQNPVSVQKFSNVFWGPSDFLKLNQDEVVWYTELRSDSQLLQLITSNPNLVPQQQAQTPSPSQTPSSSQTPSAPSTPSASNGK